MKKIELLKTIYTFWILLVIFSLSWLIHIFFNNFDMIFINPFFMIILVISAIGFILSMYFISLILVDVRTELKIEKEKQKNIQDFYRYTQTVEPPSIYN